MWATENTREAIFDAMARKEVYATTGPRIAVRFFGGWDFTADDLNSRQPAFRGYEKGVPMGGDLPARSDAQGADLPGLRAARPDRREPRPHPDRQGLARRERQDAREGLRRRLVGQTASPAHDGKLPAVGNTVDVRNATWTNTIGASELGTVWTDPDFDPTRSRVLLRPRDRDPDAALDRLRCVPLRRRRCPKDAKPIHQERAYTSPIWYTPS